MAMGPTIYNLLFKKASTFTLVMIVGALVVDTVIDYSAEAVYNSVNQGKLWHHIEHKYISKEENE